MAPINVRIQPQASPSPLEAVAFTASVVQ